VPVPVCTAAVPVSATPFGPDVVTTTAEAMVGAGVMVPETVTDCPDEYDDALV